MENGLVKVVAPMDDTPAAKAGILSGDLITQIDGDAGAGPDARAGRQQDEGPGRHQDPAQDPAQGRGRADRRHASTREIIRVRPVTLPHRRRRHRLYPDHLVQRADHRRPAQGDRRYHQADPAGQARRLCRRPPQQSRRIARPGGLGVLEPSWRAARWSRRGAATPEETQRFTAHGGDLTKGKPLVRADQRRLGLGVGDRGRRAARSQARHADRHPLVRQGLGADHHPARQPATARWH